MQKKSVIFQSNGPYTCAFCTFWGVGITPKSPSGHHASVGMTQQLERLALGKDFNWVSFICKSAFQGIIMEKTLHIFVINVCLGKIYPCLIWYIPGVYFGVLLYLDCYTGLK